MKLSPNVHAFIEQLQTQIDVIVQTNYVGTYIHGSLALGGFHEQSSDVDLIVVIKKPLPLIAKKRLTTLFLTISKQPYPIEISFLTLQQIAIWKHPCRFDFHYSEYWRKRLTDYLQNNTLHYILQQNQIDVDLAAHIMNECGICFKGKPIHEVFPTIPKTDYLQAIMADFYDCLENIESTPVYSILNMLRVYLYIKQEKIYAKHAAGIWGSTNLPSEVKETTYKALHVYQANVWIVSFTIVELKTFTVFMCKELDLLL